jgi:hypothetical protein
VAASHDVYDDADIGTEEAACPSAQLDTRVPGAHLMYKMAVNEAANVLPGRNDLAASFTNLAGSVQLVVFRIKANELSLLEPPFLNLLLTDVVDLGQ